MKNILQYDCIADYLYCHTPKHPECSGRGHRDDAISGRGTPPVLLKLTSLTAVIMATGGRSPEISNQPSNEEDELIKGE